jgi:sulfur-carrier protein
MPRVFIPKLMQGLTTDPIVEAQGGTVGELIDDLEQQFPGIRERLCHDSQLRAGIAVCINGQWTTRSLYQSIPPDGEVHFLPALGGG